MRAQLTNVLEAVRTSYWFIPSLMSFGAFALSILVLYLDRRYEDRIAADAWWIYGGGPEGAREVLSSIVASMISVTSVVFSITIVALTLAAGQFGPRILRNFMRDRGNQITLGTFIATFIYAILVMRTIRGPGSEEYVPPLSMSVAVLLTFISVGILIYFIHHIALSIQADTVVASIAGETHNAIERLYPDRIEDGASPELPDAHALLPPGFAERARRVRARRDCYLHMIDHDALLEFCCEHDLVVRIHARPGDFVVQDAILAEAWRHGAPEDERAEAGAMDETLGKEVDKSIRGVLLTGRSRTLEQDAQFGLLQLVEIAVRSMSTGINDPFTAMSCTDRLASLLGSLSGRVLPDGVLFDRAGDLRIVARTFSYPELVDDAFKQIRQNAGGSSALLNRMLEGLGTVARRTHTEEQREALRLQARLVLETGLLSLETDEDKAELRQAYSEALEALRPT